MFPICERKDFENFSLLRKLQTLPSVFHPVSLVLFDLIDSIGKQLLYSCEYVLAHLILEHMQAFSDCL